MCARQLDDDVASMTFQQVKNCLKKPIQSALIIKIGINLALAAASQISFVTLVRFNAIVFGGKETTVEIWTENEKGSQSDQSFRIFADDKLIEISAVLPESPRTFSLVR